MHRDLRIVFMGTPEFAVTTLDTIIKNGYNVVGVITAPDRPAGRGQKLKESAVKEYAKAKGLPILQPTNLKNPTFHEALKALEPNLQVVVAFRMLPEVVWRLPEFGTFNLHASLLPNYRGAAPINWAIMNGDVVTGVTTFFIDEKIDTGEMILQKQVDIDPNESAGELHDKLMHVGADLVVDTLEGIAKNNIKTIPQPKDAIFNTAHKLNKDNCKIDWSLPLKSIYDHIRGLSPYPAAWCYLKNGQDELAIKIYRTHFEAKNHNMDFGSILIEDKMIKVGVQGGYIIIDEIQLPGKRKMASKDLLNGFSFVEEAKML